MKSIVYKLYYDFFFNDTSTTEIYTYCHTLSLHDALPISLIPDIKGLTKTVREETSASQLCGKAFAQLLTVLKEDGEDTPTVEVMLNRIRALRDVAGRANVRGLTFSDLESLDQAICQSISTTLNRYLPDSATPSPALARFFEI